MPDVARERDGAGPELAELGAEVALAAVAGVAQRAVMGQVAGGRAHAARQAGLARPEQAPAG